MRDPSSPQLPPSPRLSTLSSAPLCHFRLDAFGCQMDKHSQRSLDRSRASLTSSSPVFPGGPCAPSASDSVDVTSAVSCPSLRAFSTESLSHGEGRVVASDEDTPGFPSVHVNKQFNSYAEAQQYLKLHVPLIELKIDDQDLLGSAKSIALELFPNWNADSDRLLLSRCTEGITNKLIKIQHPDTLQTILLRCYGHGTSSIINRTSELVTLLTLSSLGFAPPLYGRFLNGLCYGYVQGRPLPSDSLSTPPYADAIARHLARWHRLPMVTPQRPHLTQAPQSGLWATLNRWLDQVPECYPCESVQQRFMASPMLQVERIRKLAGWLETTVKSELPMAPVVFCHNDLLSANIIYNDASKIVQFIDYEYGGYNYRGFDIGNHFNEFAGFECDYSKYPDCHQQSSWLRQYLKEYLQCEPSDSQVDQLAKEVNLFSMASHLYWSVWALIQASLSDLDFDYIGYAMQRLNELEKRRIELGYSLNVE